MDDPPMQGTQGDGRACAALLYHGQSGAYQTDYRGGFLGRRSLLLVNLLCPCIPQGYRTVKYRSIGCRLAVKREIALPDALIAFSRNRIQQLPLHLCVFYAVQALRIAAGTVRFSRSGILDAAQAI